VTENDRRSRPKGAAPPVAALGAVGWLAGAVAAQLLRQQGIPATDTVWAEDGTLFLADALRDPLGSVVEPYTGYLHLVTRLVAAFTSLFPLRWAAFVLAAMSALIVALLSLYVLWASKGVLRTFGARLAVAISMILLPAAGYETANNATNLRWYFLFACFWPWLREPSTRQEAGADAAVVGAAGLSDPLSAIFVPLAWRAGRRGGKRARAVGVVFGAALVVQLAVVAYEYIVHEGTALRTGEFELLPAVGLFGLRVGATFLLGDQLVQGLWPLIGWWSGVVALFLLAGIVLYASSRPPMRNRLPVLYAMACSGILFFALLFLRGTERITPEGEVLVTVGLRWTVAPILFLIAGVVMLLDDADRRVKPPVWRGIRTVAAAVLVLLFISNYFVVGPRSRGPSWGRQLELAQDRCQARGLGRIRVPIAPDRPPGFWGMRIGCDRLLEEGVNRR
jgi:hypothetical protein